MKCEICEKEYNNYRILGIHIVRIHNISTKEYYDFYLKKEKEDICCVCKKETKFINLNCGYRNFCSKQCLNRSEYHKNKIKETNLERYGVEHPLQNKEIHKKVKETNLKRYGVEYSSQNKYIQEKLRQTNLERYGVEHSFQNKEIKEKIKQTNLKRYGVEYPLQNEKIQEKLRQTNLEKYGVENPSQSEEIKDKIKQTNLERYGVENPSQNKEIQDKIKQTNLERYGVENPSQNKEIQDKIKQTNLEKYGVEYFLESEEIQDKIKQSNLINYGVENYSQSYEYKESRKNETIEKYKNEFPFLKIIDYDINNRIMICYCNECKQNYNIGLMMLGSRLRYLKYSNPCTNCFPVNSMFSNEEKELVDYIKSIYDGEIIENDRNILKPLEIDIYLPELKLAFEFNGLYWHSSEYKDKNYHLDKTIECEKLGIQLVHIFENEWCEKQIEIKKYIKNLIENNNIIDENIFRNERDFIIVDRKFNNGKILEKLNYKLVEIIEPKLQDISFKNKEYKVYDCGYLKYKYIN